MEDPPNKRPCDQPNPEPQYQQQSGQYQQQPSGQYQYQQQQQPSGKYQQQPSGQYQQSTNPQYQQSEPSGETKCEQPVPPGDPCSVPPPPEACLPQPFHDRIDYLEKQSNLQEKDSSKAELAAFQKLSDEVWKAEKDYARDYETLVFQEANSKAIFDKIRTDLLNGRISDSERKRIAEIVYCRPDLEHLKKAWTDARDCIPDLQRDFTKAQTAFSDQDEIYKATLTKYQAAQKALDALQAQTSKEFNARNYRGAWFLNEFETCPVLDPPPLPCKFNEELEAVAKEHVSRSETLRKAKVALDQKTAEAQKKKKEYEDAKAKRRDDILKAIANDPFPVETKPPTSPNQPSNYQSTAA